MVSARNFVPAVNMGDSLDGPSIYCSPSRYGRSVDYAMGNYERLRPHLRGEKVIVAILAGIDFPKRPGVEPYVAGQLAVMYQGRKTALWWRFYYEIGTNSLKLRNVTVSFSHSPRNPPVPANLKVAARTIRWRLRYVLRGIAAKGFTPSTQVRL